MGQKPAPLLPEEVSAIENIFQSAEARHKAEVLDRNVRLQGSLRAIGSRRAASTTSPSSSVLACTYGAPVGTDLNKVQIFGFEDARADKIGKYCRLIF